MRVVFLLLLTISCGGGGHEAEGDRAWHAGRWERALNDYRQAGSSPRLLTKYADAALRGGFLSEAVDGWSQLAADAPDRRDEAAAGLARTVLAADQAGNRRALARALIALRQADPAWPIGRLGVPIPTEQGSTPEERIQLLLLAASIVADRNAVGSAFLNLGDAQALLGDTLAAISAWEKVVATAPVTDSLFDLALERLRTVRLAGDTLMVLE